MPLSIRAGRIDDSASAAWHYSRLHCQQNPLGSELGEVGRNLVKYAEWARGYSLWIGQYTR